MKPQQNKQKWANQSNTQKDSARAHALAERTKTQKHEQTNGEFANSNGTFKTACHKVGVEPTARQASRYRNRNGSAFKGLTSAKVVV